MCQGNEKNSKNQMNDAVKQFGEYQLSNLKQEGSTLQFIVNPWLSWGSPNKLAARTIFNFPELFVTLFPKSDECSTRIQNVSSLLMLLC